MQIQNGSVTFSRTRKPADYEGITCSVTFSFCFDEGTENVIAATDAVVKQAKALVLSNLTDRVEAMEGKAGAAARMNTEDGTTNRRRPPRAAAAKPEQPAGDPAAMTDPSQGNGTDPAAAAEARKAEHAADEKAGDPAAMSDDDILGGDSQPEVTDAALTSAITSRNAELQKNIGAEAPKKIRALIAKYAGPVPKQSRDIPQAVRNKFLAELKELS